MHYVTGDLHGYPLKKFQELLKQAHFTAADELYILGDVIDRNGDGGVEMLRWMMRQENVFFILGNHENLLLLCDFIFRKITDDSIHDLDGNRLTVLANWLGNGAEPTLNSLKKLLRENPEELEDLLDYLRDASLYDIIKVNGKTYILTHAGLGNYSPDKDLPDYSPEELLWYRPELGDNWYPNAVTIFGHTPTQYYGEKYKGKMIRSKTWIDIDTGAAAGLSPMLLRLEDEKEFYANRISPKKT